MKNVSRAKQMSQSRKPSNVSHAKHFGGQRTVDLDSVYRDLIETTPFSTAKGDAYGQA
jgi:hypothetical protein